MSIIAEPKPDRTTAARYVAVGDDVHDTLSGRVAGFPTPASAHVSAEWLNSPHATPGDYHWRGAAVDTSPTVKDAVTFAARLGVDYGDFMTAIMRLVGEARDRAPRELRRDPEATIELSGRDA